MACDGCLRKCTERGVNGRYLAWAQKEKKGKRILVGRWCNSCIAVGKRRLCPHPKLELDLEGGGGRLGALWSLEGRQDVARRH